MHRSQEAEESKTSRQKNGSDQEYVGSPRQADAERPSDFWHPQIEPWIVRPRSGTIMQTIERKECFPGTGQPSRSTSEFNIPGGLEPHVGWRILLHEPYVGIEG